uniref:Isopropylmalate dehydrogenase-like domain-containing protein n=1 Tax=Timema genevievae TaxID=629358 RepID=A0A7R9K134_TIMGE|nr:unnamed protein product [Timema genevievae]
MSRRSAVSGRRCVQTPVSWIMYGGVPVDFEVVQIDPKSETNDDLDYAITTIRRNGVAIKGNIETGSLTRGVTSRNVALRNELDLYVNVLKCQTYPGVPSRQKNIDIVIIRQNTEGEYAMLEHELANTPVVLSPTTEDGEIEVRISVGYPDKDLVTHQRARSLQQPLPPPAREDHEQQPVENPQPQEQQPAALIDNPARSTDRQYMSTSSSTGGQYRSTTSNTRIRASSEYSVFEPGARNTGTSIAGKNIANPIAMLNASVDMLEHLGHRYHAEIIKNAIDKTINEDRIHTPDLGGQATSIDVVQNIIRHLQETTKTTNW